MWVRCCDSTPLGVLMLIYGDDVIANIRNETCHVYSVTSSLSGKTHASCWSIWVVVACAHHPVLFSARVFGNIHNDFAACYKVYAMCALRSVHRNRCKPSRRGISLVHVRNYIISCCSIVYHDIVQYSIVAWRSSTATCKASTTSASQSCWWSTATPSCTKMQVDRSVGVRCLSGAVEDGSSWQTQQLHDSAARQSQLKLQTQQLNISTPGPLVPTVNTNGWQWAQTPLFTDPWLPFPSISTAPHHPLFMRGLYYNFNNLRFKYPLTFNDFPIPILNVVLCFK